MRIMTVDVEYDYETEKSESVPLMVPRLLDFFRARGMTATFFVLGKIAEKYPSLIKSIAKEHEVASHCYEHIPLQSLPEAAQREQLRKGKQAIEALSIPCEGVRAPYFMTGRDHARLVADAGFRYDSSQSTFFPGRYRHWPRSKPYVTNSIIELPVPNWFPLYPPAGLSYYRLFHPLSLVCKVPFMLYLHPCEFMVAPMTNDLSRIVRSVYARNQGERAWQLFTQLIDTTPGRWVSCRQYIKEIGLLPSWV